MPKQTVPDIQFGKFVIAEIPKHFDEQKILINTNYQRGDIWKQKQQIGLIKSIVDRYSIGVLVLFINDSDQFEILDGQQRLLTIHKYVTDKLDLAILKDEERLHDVEQKRILFFRQQGLCAECKKPMDFKNTSSHHVIPHAAGGKTSNLDYAQLLHEKCHKKVEKRKRKQDQLGEGFSF